ncbi:MAG: hypothetical protein H7841_12390 [Magnetospirillum sp. WYHS-4]
MSRVAVAAGAVVALLALAGSGMAETLPSRTCLYVSSYHPGYHWNDGIERGLEKSLAGVCRLERFYMDTNRNPAPEFSQAKGAEAKALIEAAKPDLVVACDDNASKDLVKPFLKDAPIPVVFCGVNWTVAEYGYPYANTTGMIEVAPNKEVVQEAKALLKGASSFAFLAADVPTQHKEVARLDVIAKRESLEMQALLVKSFADWQAAFRQAQERDFVVLGNPVGIPDWNGPLAKTFVAAESRKLTTSFGIFMRPYSVFSMVNVPDEQGEWAGEAAKLILDGRKPADIPIVANRRWDLFFNPALAAKAGIHLPDHILQRAVKID